MNERTYNGWTNYETWNVKLWIDNDQSSYNYWNGRAQECYDEAEFTGSVNAREERAALDLAKKLEENIKQNAPDLGSTTYADLLNASLCEVNWYEIAQALMEEVQKEEPETAA